MEKSHMVIPFLVDLTMIAAFVACASVQRQESTGEYIDDSVITAKIKTQLIVHPTNPRYFTDGSGKAIYMTGSHTWYLVQNDPTSPPATDQFFTEYLNWSQAHGHNFLRLWTAFSDANSDPYPWQRTGPGTAYMDGKMKFDMTQYNQTFFDTLKRRVQQVQDRGMYCSVMLFGSFNGMRDNFKTTAWHEANNINHDLAAQFTDDPDSFCKATGNALDIQRAQARKFIDELNGFNNIVWEIINEMGKGENDPACVAWHHNMVDYVKQYESTKPKQHPVGMTGGQGLGNSMLTGNHDWISPDRDMGYYEGGHPDFSKYVIISDTDHIRNPENTGWGASYLEFAEDMRKWVWKTFTRGHNPIFMDTYKTKDPNPRIQNEYGVVNPAFDGVRKAMGYTRSFTLKFSSLADMIPSDNPVDCSTTYCLRRPGVEYLVYQPNSGASFTVDLAAGDYIYEWFNPSTGVVTSSGSITSGGENSSFTPPFSGDAVLYLRVFPSPVADPVCGGGRGKESLDSGATASRLLSS